MTFMCDYCGCPADPPTATATFAGYRETVVLAFCEQCTRRPGP